jgi:peptide/nickel transport system substrate-binding protein
MKWSTGAPITSRDVEFWINLLEAKKTSYGPWAPGTWPTILKVADYPSANTIVLHLNASYDPVWFTGTALPEIIPIPQHAWDKLALSGSVGTYDTTRSGAVRVYDFLNAQASTTASYATSPLWKIVDGPYKLLSNTPTGKYTFVPNLSYFGPKSHISELVELPFTSQAAENDALLTGRVDYGYISNTEVPEVARLAKNGFNVAPWPFWGINYLYLNYSNPATGPMLKQQYVRVAMQELINQPQLIKTVFKGYAYPTYGPVPSKPVTSYASPEDLKAEYPYDPKRAVALLRSHGWKVVPTGQTICVDPLKCGAGIKRGTAIKLTVVDPTGFPEIDNMMRAIASSMSSAGIVWTLRTVAIAAIGSDLTLCKPGSSCPWSILQYVEAYYWVPEVFPTGGPMFGSGAALYEGTAPYSARLDQFIQDVRLAGASQEDKVLYRYESFLNRVSPVLWIPNVYNQISVIKNSLRGAVPQDPIGGEMTPQLWYVSRS